MDSALPFLVLSSLLAAVPQAAGSADPYAQIRLPTVDWAAGEAGGVRVGILSDGAILLEEERVGYPESGASRLGGTFEDARSASNARDVQVFADARADAAALGVVTESLFGAGFSHYSLRVRSSTDGTQLALPMVRLTDDTRRDADLVGRVLRPLVVHVLAEGVWVGREASAGLYVPNVEGAMDVATVKALVARDRANIPKATWTTPWFDRGRTCGDVATVLSILEEAGYRRILAGFGDERAEPLPPPFPETLGPIRTASSVIMERDGTFHMETGSGRVAIEPAKTAGFQRDCEGGTCDVVLVTADGKRYYVARTPNPVTPSNVPYLVGRPVRDVDLSEVRDTRPPLMAGTWDVAVQGSLSNHFSMEFYPRTDDIPGGGRPSNVAMGYLDMDEIEPVIRDQMDGISRCYRDVLKETPGLSGKMEVKFVIDAEGAVSSAVARASTLNNPTVEQCVLGELQKLKFNKPKGSGFVVVSFPFTFRPE